MNRKIYISDKTVSLAEFLDADLLNSYNCWLDDDTQRGYNFKRTETFEEYKNQPVNSRFLATIILNTTKERIGEIFVSPDGTLPDLAIMIYKSYRHIGYGTAAFLLGIRYCFAVLKLGRIYAGCYEDNAVSIKMIMKCGFVPHPEGNVTEKHYLTGEPITQYDFVLKNENTFSQ